MTINLPLKPDMSARVVTDENGQHIEIDGTAEQLITIEGEIDEAVKCYDCGNYHEELEDVSVSVQKYVMAAPGATHYERIQRTVPLCPNCARGRSEGPGEPDPDDAYERSRDEDEMEEARR